MINHLLISSQNYFSNNPLDRLSPNRPDIDLDQALHEEASTLIVPIWQGKHLASIEEPARVVFLSTAEAQPLIQNPNQLVFLGKRGGNDYFAIHIQEEDPSTNPFWQQWGTFESLRSLGKIATLAEGAILGYAQAMIYWHSTHQFCGRCGTATRSDWAGHVRICQNPDCGKKHFPRTDPAIITLITYQDQGLLVRQSQWQPANRFSLVAGFVEPGESLEEAVQREVMEETGLEVNEVEYQSSQPWPFPGSIMLGFRAEATHQNFELIDQELEKARWFTRAQLKDAAAAKEILLSPKMSISRMLIDAWLKEE
ncbi:MAG TPA: NAD(+) diphosphatase [Microscillaceae bacterium]|nr:NAD(+) diphosphatase [Microscillaceae bacterium]